MKQQAQLFEKLTNLLSQERIDQRLNELVTKKNWYARTYSLFIERFEKTRKEISTEAWVERTALIYSWLPTLPLNSFKYKQVNLDKEIRELSELESSFYDADITTIGQFATRRGTEIVFPPYQGHQSITLKAFLEPASRLLHKDYNQNTQLSSTTKLLHFMCPRLFPIFDRKVCKYIFGSEHQSYKRYNEYVYYIQQYLLDGKEAGYIKRMAKKHQFSPLYIIDLIIFSETS